MYYKVDQRIQSLLCHKKQIIIGIDGKAASGKSTLATYLKEKYNATIYCMDDYFLQPHQRTEERSKMIGGNVDFERFLEQVLIPLKNNQEVKYQIYDCKTQTLNEIQLSNRTDVVVIEGSYSMRPELIEYYDLKIGITIESQHQVERIMERNKNYEDFINRWIPLENSYLDFYSIFDLVNIVLYN